MCRRRKTKRKKEKEKDKPPFFVFREPAALLLSVKSKLTSSGRIECFSHTGVTANGPESLRNRREQERKERMAVLAGRNKPSAPSGKRVARRKNQRTIQVLEAVYFL